MGTSSHSAVVSGGVSSDAWGERQPFRLRAAAAPLVTPPLWV
jgi:hypothetical protein